ncbi:hypothetical protein CAC42_7864 [Sphaceloma murrayae]|uniref:Asparagine synthetase domain-containing protein n=1 Tax=Sphaceloma murrayae TaxID=2082308 RepID=A0A2K1QXY6_9PEZI|nr:hypothetical protein CAC42_7864 [Sphaceloma murrayae]
MCGIFLALDREHDQLPTPEIQDLLMQRGPDSLQKLAFCLHSKPTDERIRQDSPVASEDAGRTTIPKRHDCFVTCLGSVLSLRGSTVTKQPISDDRKVEDSASSFLCWNGEAWSFATSSIRGNDSIHVFNLLSHICQCAWRAGDEHPELALAEALSAYAGPYAFTFYDHLYRRIYCGRDFLGRRSLLKKITATGVLVSSIPDNLEDWEEIEADGVYWVDLDSGNDFCFQRAPYQLSAQSLGSSRSNSSFQLELPRQWSSASRHKDGSARAGDPTECLHRLLVNALLSRICTIPSTSPEPAALLDGKPAKLAVLFSGGIDCTVLARLAHETLSPSEPIDLLNVAFENPRIHRQGKNADLSPYEQCPDRKTAASSLAELRTSCPGRQWRLLRINVPYDDFLKHRPKVISLIRPHNTEMDLSIASALYFAARGIGLLEDDSPFETKARVLLSGLGADELFAGYTRHATAYSRGGFEALQAELALDISRLGKRNLGRDDRVISHWAKEARYPFLDEDLIKWALSASLQEKCGFGDTSPPLDPSGAPLDPAKTVLRRLALKLGLPRVAQEKKRAIQFGARTAKMEVKKTKGTQQLTVSAC